MHLRLKSLRALVAVFLVGLGGQVCAQPLFENNTPVGFSPSDSTTTTNFVLEKDITILVDLNEPANATYPVIGNFQKFESAEAYFSTAGNAAYMDQAIAVDDNGVIHRAWIQQRGVVSATNSSSTPVYGVVYAKSFDGGDTFSDTVSVSGTLRFDMITPNIASTGAYSTLDLVVDSKGNPRVVYAMDMSADSRHGDNTSQTWSSGVRAYNNIYFNYSNDGGSSWLPANNAVVVNDTSTAGGTFPGRKTAFPRMAITATDDIFVVYERDLSSGNVDVMLSKLDADSLKLGSAQPVLLGPEGNSNSTGGLRLDPNGVANVGPDITVGDDDVLHVVWFDPANDQIEHKTLAADQWTDLTSFGWDHDAAGATVSTMQTDGTNLGIAAGGAAEDWISANFMHLFPTIAVDKARSPDRVYIVWKYTDSAAAGDGADENILYNFYDYDGQVGAPSGVWPTESAVFPTGTGLYSANGSGPLFQAGTRYLVEDYWSFVDRVAVVIDERKITSGDVHVVFAGGVSAKNTNITVSGFANNLYYTRFNGVEWELPQVVASANNGTSYGVNATHSSLFSPDIAIREDDDNIYMTFVGGSSTGGGGADWGGTTVTSTPGRGYATQNTALIAPLPYFKLLGRVVTYDDISIPNGANMYELVYTPVNAHSATTTKNMAHITVADNESGSGIGATTPGASAAPGGFLTGQWQRVGTTLGVSSLVPGTAGAVFKGAISQIQAQNDNGVFEGDVDDSGSNSFAEWGDDDDKSSLLVKLNVLGSDSSTNLFIINASTAAVNVTSATDGQNINLQSYTAATDPTGATFVNGIVGESTPSATTAPLGSYFQIGANINIVADNTAPVVAVTSPDANTISSGAFSNESAKIRYVLYDEDDDASGNLDYELYYYPDNGFTTVLDIRTFGVLIVDENDVTDNVNGTDDFAEGSAASNVQDYTWDDAGATLSGAYNWAAITKTLDGAFYIYIVADDGVNPPVYDVSEGPLQIRHIPLVNSITPVKSDTVDTGEYENLDKSNPYKIRFDLVDYDDNAQVRLFFATSTDLDDGDVTIGGTFPSQTLDLAGATEIQLSDSLFTDDAVEFDFDVTAQGAGQDSVINQGNYYIYAVVADDDTFALGRSDLPLSVRHSPAFEFTAPLLGTVNKLNTTRQFRYSIEWQRGRSDQDLDGNATISLYYVGVDPQSVNFTGTDSSALIDSGAVLISGDIREDDEGASDQFVWNFRNPPGNLPKVYRPKPSATTAPANASNPHVYQVGEVTDTAWVYAVMYDTLGNTRVQAGGAVLLLGSQESPASQAPRVTMKTPPPGDQLLINGDVVRLEWDSFLIDDGTGTDDAYLRLYAAPKGKYSTLTELESNNIAESGDVYLINSLTGQDDVASNIVSLRESDDNFYMWDTKTTSFEITGTPTEFDIFIAASIDPDFGEDIYVNNMLDSVATGIGSNAQQAILSKSPGVLRVDGTDPIYSVEMGPAALTASSDDTLTFEILVNSQGSSIDQIALYLNVPRQYFEVVDQDTSTAGVQPFADSTGAFQTPSTIAQNDTTQGTEEFINVNFVESVLLGEVVGRVVAPFDSSQVAATLQLRVKRFSGGAPLPVELEWSSDSDRRTALYRGTVERAAPARDTRVILTPRARIIATVPLEGRTDYSDTLDVHMRQIGSTQDITDQTFIAANDVTPSFAGGGSSGSLEDSVQVVSNTFGTFTLTEIPPGIYEVTVKAPGYVTGRSDTLNLFNGTTATPDVTFGSDLMGNLSPATSIGFLRGGDATNDNQVDIADANLIFSVWNQAVGDPGYDREADINADGVINPLDLGYVTTNFGNDGYGAPPVFKRVAAGDNSAASLQLEGIDEVDAWWPGRVVEVRARATAMADVAAYGLRLSYDPERVQLLEAQGGIEQGDIFKSSPRGALFYHRAQEGLIEVTGGRIGTSWSANGDADLALLRFVTLTDEPAEVKVLGGELVNSAYEGSSFRLADVKALPKIAALEQNYPNPFNPSTEIRFQIPSARDVQLKIYNQLGQNIKTLVNGRMKAGAYNLKWDGTNSEGQSVASGIYFYRIEAGDFSKIRKMTLLK